MKDYGISDYGVFQTASSSTKTLITRISDMQTVLNKYKDVVGNDSVFIGPIAENCLTALDNVNSGFQSSVDNYNEICNFFSLIETNYKNADYEALEKLLSISSVDADSTVATTPTSSGVVDAEALGGQFSMVNTRVSVLDYFKNVITNKKVYQTSGPYGDQCLGFACTHAWGLYTNDENISSSNCKNDCAATNHFKSYTTNNEADFLSKVYNEVISGKPVVIQVSGNKSRGTRHYVSVVGINKNVKSAADLKTTDLLIIDSYDGKLEKIVPKGDKGLGRYVIKGTDTSNYKNGNKDYNYGYQLLYIR